MRVAIIGAGQVGGETLKLYLDHFAERYIESVNGNIGAAKECLNISLVTRDTYESEKRGQKLIRELEQIRNDEVRNEYREPLKFIEIGVQKRLRDLKNPIDLVIVAAQAPPLQPNQIVDLQGRGIDDRTMLSYRNLGIITKISNDIKLYAPKAKVVVFTNQADHMVRFMRSLLGPEQVAVGFGNSLDTGRFLERLKNFVNIPGIENTDLFKKCLIVGYHNRFMDLLEECKKEICETTKISKMDLKPLLDETRDEGIELSMSKKSSSEKGLGGEKQTPSLFPAYLAAKFIAALVKAIPPFKTSVNFLLQGPDADRYGVLSGTGLSVPVVVGGDGFKLVKDNKISKLDRIFFAQKSKKMDEEYENLMNYEKSEKTENPANGQSDESEEESKQNIRNKLKNINKLLKGEDMSP
jgi:malate/lactate dehydrogenase